MSWKNKLFTFLIALWSCDSFASDTLQQHLGNDANKAVAVVSVVNGRVLASMHMERLEQAYPPGSLMKLFATIAYYQEHGPTYPVFQCPPTLPKDSDGCWDRNGHGPVSIVEALAHSCNVYFRQLAEKISPEQFRQTLASYDLRKSNSLPDREMMVGKTIQWTVSPMMLLRAYSAIFHGGYLYPYSAENQKFAAKHTLLPDDLLKILRTGLRQSCETGTSLEAKKISGLSLLGKTGTSLLWNDGKVNWKETQGTWIGLYPADKPEIAVIAFVQKGRGATHAAPLGGKAIAWYLQSR